MRVQDVLPALAVERLAVGGEELARLVDVRLGDRRAEVFLEEGLQAEHHALRPTAAARLDVAVDVLDGFGILQVVAGFVAIHLQQRIVIHDFCLKRLENVEF